MGGTMDSTVVVAVCRGLAVRGWATLRFDFRGAGRSEGAFDGGHGEMGDVAAALGFLASQAKVDANRLAVVGYSFGASVALHQAVRDARARWLVGIALVQEHYDDPFLNEEQRPKLFVAAEHDPWAPPELLRTYVSRLRPPATLRIVAGTDHLFARREDEVADIIGEWLQDADAQPGAQEDTYEQVH
jgi:hypothetical protein